MIIRSHYLEKLRPFYDSDLIKIITGIRRCGKSVILSQAMEEIKGAGKSCIFLDFELRTVRKEIKNADELISHVQRVRGAEKLYLFLDEIQLLSDWSDAVKTLRLMNCSVFISGSNSKLLSGEFARELSGRYVSLRVRPFVYREALQFANQLGKDYTIGDYLVWGGFPASIAQPNEAALKTYLNDLNDTIILNDLENRYSIRKKDAFERLVNFVLISNARPFSAKSISDYFKGQGMSVSVPTVISYIDYLKEAYIINEMPLYSEKAKSKLSYLNKIYDEDVSLNSIRQGGNRFDVTHNLENIVLNELIYMGYEVSTFGKSGREIDFRAVKDGKTYYVQVAYSVAEEKTYEREFSAFSQLDNSSKKIIITNDELDYSTSTVYHYKLRDFLLMDEL